MSDYRCILDVPKELDGRNKEIVEALTKLKSLYGEEYKDECLFLVGRINGNLIRCTVGFPGKEKLADLYYTTLSAALDQMKESEKDAFYTVYMSMMVAVLECAEIDKQCRNALLSGLQHMDAHIKAMEGECEGEAN